MRCRLALILSGVIGWIEIPQCSSLRPYQGVLSFLSGSTGGTGSETPRVHHAARRRGARAAGRARLAYWRDTLAADCRSVFYYFYKLKFQKNPAFARRFLRATWLVPLNMGRHTRCETRGSHREESIHMNRKRLVGLLAAGCFVA